MLIIQILVSYERPSTSLTHQPLSPHTGFNTQDTLNNAQYLQMTNKYKMKYSTT